MRVARDVYEGILAVRDSGLTSMFDRLMVAKLARKMGFTEAANYCNDPANRKAYVKGIFGGFEPNEEVNV